MTIKNIFLKCQRHQQQYDTDMQLLINRTKFPLEVINHILSLSGSKNYYAIYQQCLKDLIQKINNTKVVYTIERLFGTKIYNDDNTVHTPQITIEYLRRYNLNSVPQNFDEFEETEKVFYIEWSLENYDLDDDELHTINHYEMFITEWCETEDELSTDSGTDSDEQVYSDDDDIEVVYVDL